jgi:endonuclease/exonuclease/phosphatase family metal-dependent hydrolase
VVTASTDKVQMQVGHLNSGAYAKDRYRAYSTRPTITLTGMRYTTAAYYYRVGRIDAARPGFIYWAADYSPGFGLRPAHPTALKIHAGTDGTYLSWTAGAATGAWIEQATDAAFTTGYHRFTVHGTSHLFTPYGLNPKYTYWFRVRSTNHATVSTASTAVTRHPVARTQALRVMSYNLLGANLDGQPDPPGGAITSWTARVTAAAYLVKAAKPDVLAVQEAYAILGASSSQYPGQPKYHSTWKIPGKNPCTAAHYADPAHYPYRQVDSLCDALGHGTVYRRALDGTAQHNGYGNYLIYNAQKLSLYGHGGWVSIGYSRYAAWQAFTVKATGVKFLVASPHTSAELGATWDARRKVEVAELKITRIIYAGDFNTYTGRAEAPDVTTPLMTKYHYADSIDNAQSATDTQDLSGNFYTRMPKKTPTGAPGWYCIDHIYLSPGIAVTHFGEALHLTSSGAFSGTIPSDHNPVYADLLLSY